jgi:putative transposase
MSTYARFFTAFHCVYAHHYRLVLLTKYRYRRKCITGPIDRLREIVGQRCEDWDGELVGFNGETDHVHILASRPPILDRSRFVNNVKTTSSRLIRRDFGRELPVAGLLWSRAYGIITCGGAPLPVLKQYVEQQEAPE